MNYPQKSLKVSAETHMIVRELSEKYGVPQSQLVDYALRNLEHDDKIVVSPKAKARTHNGDNNAGGKIGKVEAKRSKCK